MGGGRDSDDESSSDDEGADEQYETAAIHNRRNRYTGRGKGKKLDGCDYLIEWENWPNKKDWQWVPDNQLNSPDILKNYNDLLGTIGSGDGDDSSKTVYRREKTEGERRKEYIDQEIKKISINGKITQSEYDTIEAASFIINAVTTSTTRSGRLSK